MLWRDGVVVAEGWHWPYSAERRRMTHFDDQEHHGLRDRHAGRCRRCRSRTRCAASSPKRGRPGQRDARMTIGICDDALGPGQRVSGSIWRGIATSWIDESSASRLDHEPGPVHVYSSAASYYAVGDRSPVRRDDP